jgi:hypothetical protein
MKNILWIFLILPSIAFSQIKLGQKEDAVKIHQLIDQYSEMDTVFYRLELCGHSLFLEKV